MVPKMDFTEIFGDSAQVKLVQFLLKTRGNLMNLSEIARRTMVANSTVGRVIQNLIKIGLVAEVKVGNMMKVIYLVENHHLTRSLLKLQEEFVSK